MARRTLNIQQPTAVRVSTSGWNSFSWKATGRGSQKRDFADRMSMGIVALGLLFLPSNALAQGLPIPAQGRTPATLSVGLTSGFTSTFQLILGGTFGPGHDVQDKLTTSIDNAFLSGDSVSAFGWSTTDLSNMTPNWQAGLLYKLPILHRKYHTLSLTAGGQRWILPLVGRGTKDWFVTSNLTYGTLVKRVPVFVSEDLYSLVKSNLPTGNALYSQIYMQHPLANRRGLKVMLREGPAYTYSWGLYGCSGNRVLRYSGTLVSSWRGTSLETGYRRQFGLQDKIPSNGYWSILVSRQLTRSFSR